MRVKTRTYKVRVMKKWILCLSAYLVAALHHGPATAHEPTKDINSVSNTSQVDDYIAQVFKKIDFSKSGHLSYDVFEKAYRGYLNLRIAGKLNNERPVLTICDFSRSANTFRLWIIDLGKGKVVFNNFVAHGQGSGEEFANSFSNQHESHQSSLGFYVTGDTYIGEHGLSLRLHGMDAGYNTEAYDRGIVVHGADYVSKDFIRGNERLGRSWGCPAVSSAIAPAVINTIKEGTCLFIYYPHKAYLKTAYWLNKKIERLPDDNIYQQLQQPVLAAAPAEKKDSVVIIYEAPPAARPPVSLY